MQSMTGYGKGIIERDNIKVTVELRAVNHRYLDLSFKFNKNYVDYIEVIRKTLNVKLKRGHIDVYLDIQNNQENIEINFNEQLLKAYVSAGEKLSKLGIVNDLTSSVLIKMPEVVTIEQDENKNLLNAIIEEATSAAADALTQMRKTEGEMLEQEISKILTESKSFVNNISELAPSVKTTYKERIEALVKGYLEGAEIDESRLLTEVALYADKSNIDEEITRLEGHISHFEEIIKGNGEVGKKIDFLLQECNREINTIGSKCNNMIITKNVLLLKNNIEKIREQIQNVE